MSIIRGEKKKSVGKLAAAHIPYGFMWSMVFPNAGGACVSHDILPIFAAPLAVFSMLRFAVSIFVIGWMHVVCNFAGNFIIHDWMLCVGALVKS